MRVTLKMLQAKVDYINEETGNPMEAYTRDENGIRANIGNYHISQAYGGVALAQIATSSGGVSMPTHSGHISKRELALQLDGFIAALRK